MSVLVKSLHIPFTVSLPIRSKPHLATPRIQASPTLALHTPTPSLRRSQVPPMAQEGGNFLFSPPWLVASALLVLSLSVWIIRYISEWLHDLDVSSSNSMAPTFIEDPSTFKKVQLPSLFNPAGKYISLIMPAFNEEARLPVALDDTLRYLQKRSNVDENFTYEIIIVDDGSTDGTAKVASDYVRRFKSDLVRVIKQGKNYGKGAAVRKGMVCAQGQLLLMLDSDGATKISDLEKLENEIFKKTSSKTAKTAVFTSDSMSAVAFGSRAHLEEKALATRKWYRNFLMKGFHTCVLLVAGPGVRDTQCGFKMFTRSAALQLFTNARLRRWCFDVELVYLCKKLSIPIMEVAVNWTEIPGSKVTMLSIFHMLLELILVRVGYGLGIWKIRVSKGK